jgi:hypothetical protein
MAPDQARIVVGHQGSGYPFTSAVGSDRGEVSLNVFPTRIVTTSEEVTELIVALGLQPVGVGSSRVDLTRGDRIFDGYYLTAEQIGSPVYVGAGPFKLRGDHRTQTGSDRPLPPGRRRRQAGADRTDGGVRRHGAGQLAAGAAPARRGHRPRRQAADVIDAFDAELGSARRRLAPVVAVAPRISVIYPNYRGSPNTYVFGREFALAQVFPDLGLQLVGIEKAAPVFAGVGAISPELLGDIDTDTIIAVGPVDWTKTASEPILSILDVPMLWVEVDESRPSAGPLTSPQLLRKYVEALVRHYKV